MKFLTFLTLITCISCASANKPATCLPVPETDNLTEGLVAHYPFNGNANDVSGNNNHGVVYGAVLTKDRNNIENNAYYFDGNLSYIDIGNSPKIKRYQNDFTVSGWIRLESFCPTYNTIILSNRNSSTVEPSGSMVGVGGLKSSLAEQIEFIKNATPTNDNFTYDYLGSGKSILLNTWTHFAITYKYNNEIANTVAIYIDGELQTSKTIGATLNPLLCNTFIGCEPSLSPVEYSLNGYLDEIRLYSRVLSASEITKLSKL
ncbi:MAG: LamG domain-containing protein [Cytophaga sp.]|uniref:LamG domain-containing protein n=1 Tax=Cytophaga sp. TaxID=29535 RepID=UPI003F822102